MPALHLSSHDFPPQMGLPPAQRLDFSWDELVWSAITVGRRELDHVLRHGVYSLYEISYRCALLWANLREDQHGWVIRSSAYDGLDPSEKSAISYFLGLTITKLLAARFLQVPWLLHLDVYREELDIDLAPGGRPDLLGLNDQGGWVVMEAKGRTNSLEREALDRAKEQTTFLNQVGPAVPVMGVGVQAHFRGSRLAATWADPPRSDDPKRSFRLDLSSEKLKGTYYRPFRSLLDEVEAGKRRVFLGPERFADTVRFPDSDVEVGLASDTPLLELAEDQPEPVDAGGFFEGADGVVVRLGERWSGEQMRLEPQSRV